MLGVKINIKNAQKIKKFLLNNNLMDKDKLPDKNDKFIYFPVKRKFQHKEVIFVNKIFRDKKKKENWKEQLEKKLTKKELKLLKTAHDVVGNIAILEIPPELESKEKIIANNLLKSNKNILTVLKKGGEHSGVFRTQKMNWVAGEKTKETIYKENNVKMKLDVEKVFFSARLSTERKRIAKQIKKDEKVMVLFSGCAPYVCVFAKNTTAKEVWGIELNPEGHKYGMENVKINKLKNVTLIYGDVRKEVPKIKDKFDRISMQLPKSAEDFLPQAFMLAKKGTIIHFYDFEHESEFSKTENKIKSACKTAGLKYEVLGFFKCGQFSPRKFRVCLDFKIL